MPSSLVTPSGNKVSNDATLTSINDEGDEDRGALRGTPGSAYPQPEPNATELPSSAPGRPKLIKLHASAHSPTPTRAEEHIATTPDCRLRALARRRAPKRTSHYTCWCERNTLRETLGALATWVPATAMLPLPLALSLSLTSSWQQHNFSLSAPRRSAGTAAAARSCGVAAATATMCAEHSRSDVRCRCVPRALRLPICASRPRPLPDPRTASRLPICKACLKDGTAWLSDP